MYYYVRNISKIYGYKKNFGLGSVDFPTILYSYPSYLGIDILTANDEDMPASLLGFTNGKVIVVKDSIDKEVSDFVLLHEEEHVKDMSASEMEVDKRALRRLISRKDEKKIKSALDLLEKRWKIKIPSPNEFLSDKMS